jgi:hypothetical protein
MGLTKGGQGAFPAIDLLENIATFEVSLSDAPLGHRIEVVRRRFPRWLRRLRVGSSREAARSGTSPPQILNWLDRPQPNGYQYGYHISIPEEKSASGN